SKGESKGQETGEEKAAALTDRSSIHSTDETKEPERGSFIRKGSQKIPEATPGFVFALSFFGTWRHGGKSEYRGAGSEVTRRSSQNGNWYQDNLVRYLNKQINLSNMALYVAGTGANTADARRSAVASNALLRWALLRG